MPLVYAPPHSGVTTWINSGGRGWLDGTQMAIEAGLHSSEWSRESCTDRESETHFRAIDEFLGDFSDCNMATTAFFDKIPDIVVLIDEKTHRGYVSQSSGASWSTVSKIRTYLKQMCNRFGIVSVPSFEAAAKLLLV